uniref:Tubulin/FtsZ GTPase domain-containing protein n=1 Tax=Acanthochromis polyacanthus TaxID=80966 RepID=A0A3Q1FHX0_9TELE
MREIVHLQIGQCGNQIGSKVVNMFPGPCLWTWSLAPWTVSEEAASGPFLDQTTSSMVRQIRNPGTTGRRATIPRGPSWWSR